MMKPTEHPFRSMLHPLHLRTLSGFLLAAAACGAATVVIHPMMDWMDPANINMLFLLVVFLVALRLGRGPALFAALLSVALFDFFFVPPHFSFAVADAQYLLTFVVMLAVALTTGQMAARLRSRVDESSRSEIRTRDLYLLARELAGVIREEQVAAILDDFLRRNMDGHSVLYLPDDLEKLVPVGDSGMADDLAQRAYQREEVQERLGATGHGETVLYLPLCAPMRVRGVLAVALSEDRHESERGLVDAVASLAALTLERLHYVQVAQESELNMASERLRASILSSLSHDLRTPLTALVGLADTLARPEAGLPSPHRETAQALRDQAMDMSLMATNLLDLARLHTGEVKPRLDWQSLEEVVGAAVAWLGKQLDGHPLHIELAPDLPLLAFDPLLMERVLANLLGNAARHTAPRTPVFVRARLEAEGVEVEVSDRGGGYPEGVLRAEAFRRGASEPAQTGAGLGLAICREVVAAHGGRLRLDNPPEGGARARFTLARGNPPGVEEEA